MGEILDGSQAGVQKSTVRAQRCAAGSPVGVVRTLRCGGVGTGVRALRCDGGGYVNGEIGRGCCGGFGWVRRTKGPLV